MQSNTVADSEAGSRIFRVIVALFTGAYIIITYVFPHFFDFVILLYVYYQSVFAILCSSFLNIGFLVLVEYTYESALLVISDMCPPGR
jgi:hypothetical protein